MCLDAMGEIDIGDDPTVIEAEKDVTANLWTKKGRRLYLNGFGDRYIDLDAGTIEGGYTGGLELDVDPEAGTLTVTGRGNEPVVVDLDLDDEAETGADPDWDNAPDMGAKGLPEGTRENDIRETREARERKTMGLMGPEHDWENDFWGYHCPVCGADLVSGEDADFDHDTLHDPDAEGRYDPDTYVGGVGTYHVAHLSREEYEYTREREREHERDWDGLAVKAEIQERNRTLAGGAAGRHGAPPDLPRESAMAGLGPQSESSETDRNDE